MFETVFNVIYSQPDDNKTNGVNTYAIVQEDYYPSFIGIIQIFLKNHLFQKLRLMKIYF
jgi:hypothetical protein